MKHTLKAGASIDTLTQTELAESLGANTAQWFQELARGFSHPRFNTSGTVAGAALTIPDINDGNQSIGPEDGWVWRIDRLTVAGLATNDTVTLYRDDTNPLNLVDTLTSTKPTIYPGRGLILRGGESLVMTGSALTATGQITMAGEATEASEPDIYKLLGL